MKKLLLILGILTLFITTVKASHIVGGDVQYQFVGVDAQGNYIYNVDIIIYRDCSPNVSTQFDDPANVGIFDQNGNVIQSLELPFNANGVQAVVPPPLLCGTVPNGACVESFTYQTQLVLPPIPGGYYIMYQRCCRNSIIDNIVGPSNAGASYIGHIPGSNVSPTAPQNSNPIIGISPTVYACVNLPLSLNYSATDADGDSLVYGLCTPYDGGQATFQPTPNQMDWPLQNVIWDAPYSLTDIMGGSPPLSINPNTGLLVGYPVQLGTFVFSICISEYRNGVYLGETKRDIQLNVVDCQIPVVASFSSVGSGSSVAGCNNTIQFNNASVGATGYVWNFGDTTTLADTSNLFQPTYAYPGPGVYQVSLIAINPQFPDCQDTLRLPVTIQQVQASFSNPQVNCATTVNFQNNSTGAGLSYNWNFGDLSTNADVSTAQNPSYTYPQAGSYTVTLIVSTPGASCVDTFIQTIDIVNPTITSAFVTDSINFCTGQVSFINNSVGSTDFLWDFGVPGIGTDTSSGFEPTYFFPSGGTFTVTLIAIDPSPAGCNVQSTLNVTMPTPVIASVSNPPFNCSPTITYQNNSTGINNSYFWNFGDLSTLADTSILTNPAAYTYPASGNYTLLLIASDSLTGCTDTLTMDIAAFSSVASIFTTDNVDLCTGIVSFDNTSTGNGSYSWNFGDPNSSTDTSTVFEPTYQFPAGGTYNIVLITENPDSVVCNDTSTFSLTIPAPLIVTAGIDAVNCVGTPVIIGPSNPFPPTVLFAWAPAAGLNDAGIQNPVADPDLTTLYIVTATNDIGCTATDSVLITVNPYPETDIDTSLTSDCDFWTLGLTAPLIDTAAFDVTWIFSNGDTLIGPSVTNIFPLGDTVAIKVTFKNENTGCNDSLMLYQLIPSLDKFFTEPVPNAFSPNGDGINDCFKPAILPQLEACYTMTIYNRWGRKIFETDTDNTCWSGQMQGDGAKASEGVYFYVLNFKGKDYNGTVHLLTGN